MNSRVFTWYLMLNKRLLKKAGFLVILFLIPIFALVFQLCSKDDTGGFLRIALAVEDADDKLAVTLMNQVKTEGKVFQFSIYDSPEQAKQAVEAAKADVAWVFVENMQEQFQKIGAGKKQTLVKIYESEENTFLKLAREKLFATLYPHMAYYMYEDYIKNEMLPDENVSDELLREEYEVISDQDDFIEYEFLDSDQKDVNDVKYITSTFRGLLTSFMLLSGMAATMYFLQDDEKGVYSWMPKSKRIFVSWGNNVAALSLAAVSASVALLASGNYTDFGREIIAMILYIFVGASFCSILGTMCRTVKGMSIALPVVLALSIVCCPVFFNTRMPLRQVLPPYFYLYAISNVKNLLWMVIYCVIAYPLGYLLSREIKIKGRLKN